MCVEIKDRRDGRVMYTNAAPNVVVRDVVHFLLSQGCNLDYADLRHADLAGANLIGGSFRGAWFDFACLDRACLKRGSFSDASFVRATLENTNAKEADFSRAVMRRASCKRANFIGANFTGTFLDGADFTGCELQQAKLDEGALQNLGTYEGARFVDPPLPAVFRMGTPVERDGQFAGFICAGSAPIGPGEPVVYDATCGEVESFGAVLRRELEQRVRDTSRAERFRHETAGEFPPEADQFDRMPAAEVYALLPPELHNMTLAGARDFLRAVGASVRPRAQALQPPPPPTVSRRTGGRRLQFE